MKKGPKLLKWNLFTPDEILFFNDGISVLEVVVLIVLWTASTCLYYLFGLFMFIFDNVGIIVARRLSTFPLPLGIPGSMGMGMRSPFPLFLLTNMYYMQFLMTLSTHFFKLEK